MNPGTLIDNLRRHGFDASLDGETLILKPDEPDAVLPEAVVKLVRDAKPSLVTLLRSLPVFTVEEERALVDYYCALPRKDRLACYTKGREYHSNGWPWRESDLQAMRDHREGKV
jgi:hypothetical protein